ncbi:phosphoribosyltransferase family protein [Paraflavisolibacter sp. H34]|uniref:phosphoribosyltransferase n=1 Tax=Huijunlia imazamoxiresistens TaxID=3127457 RepID=UPI003016186F
MSNVRLLKHSAMFIDRRDAALQLAGALEKYRDTGAIVLGIPRGGAETGYYVARHLHARLALVICKKLGHPQNPEYAIGALAEDGSVYVNENAAGDLPREAFEKEAERQQQEIRRRIDVLRQGAPLPDLQGKTVLLVDDGIATGATVFAAIQLCRHRGAARIVVAAPVCAPSKKAQLARAADEVVVLETPEHYRSVSQVYQSFSNLTDRQAIAFVERWAWEAQPPF